MLGVASVLIVAVFVRRVLHHSRAIPEGALFKNRSVIGMDGRRFLASESCFGRENTPGDLDRRRVKFEAIEDDRSGGCNRDVTIGDVCDVFWWSC